MKIIYSIDTECDKTKGWQVLQPLQFNNIHKGIKNYLQPLFTNSGIRPTYLLSPEIIKNHSCVQYFKKLHSRVELGTHLHAEFIEPFSNMETSYSKTFQNTLSPETEYEKLKNLTNLFTETFGYKPRSFRAGRFALSKNTLSFLQDLEYWVDSSVTPDTWWMYNKKKGTNYLGAPYQPYHPHPSDFRRQGSMPLTEVPVSTLNKRLYRIPGKLKRMVNSNRRWQRVSISQITNSAKNLIWLRPTYSGLQTMKEIITILKKHSKQNEALVLCVMFHSNEFTLGTSPYTQTAEHLEVIIRNLEDFISWCNSEQNIEYKTLSEVAILNNTI